MYELFAQLSEVLQENVNIKLGDLVDVVRDYPLEDALEGRLSRCKFSESGYKRNLLYRDEFLDCYILCWLPNQKTEYHNHPHRGCVFRILKGCLTETRKSKMNIQRRCLTEGITGNITNEDGVHFMHNNTAETAISLHFSAPSMYYDSD